MIPQSQPRQRRNNSKINLLISLGFHTAIVLALTYLAAREGLLGKELKKIAVEMVKEEVPKPKEPEPEKPREIEPSPTTPTPAPETPLVETPRPVVAPPPTAGVAAPPPVAPPAAELPALVFEGGKAVQTTADPIQLYKGLIEAALRSKWERPVDVEDEKFVAELEISVDRSGVFGSPTWKRTSGHAEWDASVRRALAATPGPNRAPPTNFPPRVIVRFDVDVPTEPLVR